MTPVHPPKALYMCILCLISLIWHCCNRRHCCPTRSLFSVLLRILWSGAWAAQETHLQPFRQLLSKLGTAQTVHKYVDTWIQSHCEISHKCKDKESVLTPCSISGVNDDNKWHDNIRYFTDYKDDDHWYKCHRYSSFHVAVSCSRVGRGKMPMRGKRPMPLNTVIAWRPTTIEWV